MHPLALIAADWQKTLPVLVVLGLIGWIALFLPDPASERALFAGLLIVYMMHQIEEHLWPGGFRQYANAQVFHSGRNDWPVGAGGVAVVNIGMVWNPIFLAALFPASLRWIGLGWIGGTLVNAVIHIVASVRLRGYNPGVVTAALLFLPYTTGAFYLLVSRGALSGTQVTLAVFIGLLIHIPVAALFVVPYLRTRRTPDAGGAVTR
jgi:hypothetical protein